MTRKLNGNVDAASLTFEPLAFFGVFGGQIFYGRNSRCTDKAMGNKPLTDDVACKELSAKYAK
jgi:hypothetical protein